MSPRRHSKPGRIVLLIAVFGGLALAGAAAVSLAAGPPPTKAQAESFAQAVNLRTGDIPGFKTGSVARTTAAEQKMAVALARCAGGVDPNRAVFDSDSPDFTASSGIVQQDISSEVEILPSTTLVAQDLASVKTTRGHRCLEGSFAQGFAAMKISGVKFGKVSLKSGSVPAEGASGSFALRFEITATIHGEKIPYYSDFLGFSLGQAEVTLSALGFAAPVSNTNELDLLAVLLRRAEAAAATL